jgi:hypothetical protein
VQRLGAHFGADLDEQRLAQLRRGGRSRRKREQAEARGDEAKTHE